MKTEQILAGVNAAAQHLSEDEKKAFDYVVSNQLKKGTFGGMGDILGALVVNLRENLRNEEAKRSGRTGQKRALERIAKSRVGSKRDYMNGTFTSQDGARAVCDGYRAVRITNEAAAMPADAVERAVEPLNICACYESKATLTPCSIVPNPQKLRAMIREARESITGAREKRTPSAPATSWRVTLEKKQLSMLNIWWTCWKAFPGHLCRLETTIPYSFIALMGTEFYADLETPR